VALAGLAVVVAAGVVAMWLAVPSRVTRENYFRTHWGMSHRKRKRLARGDYRDGPTVIDEDMGINGVFG
jgi:hypothetical protein